MKLVGDRFSLACHPIKNKEVKSMRWCEVIEREAVKPVKPLTPAAGRREADRKTRISKRIADLRGDHAKQLSDLRAKLVSGNHPS